MEVLIDEIVQFLSISLGSGDGSGSGYGDGSGDGSGSGYGDGDGDGSGSGSGDGSGSGSGSGYGDGSGSGYGDGDGSGYGSGYGDGDGSGYGIKEFIGQTVYKIDDVPTIIDSVHGSYAKGRILNKDFTTKPCYIAKVDGRYFAHGETLHKARADALKKALQDTPIEVRISKFIELYPTLDTIVKNKELFEWHNTLTCSCEMGRWEFANERNIDVNNGFMSVREFVRLTKDSYGGGNIKMLEKAYE